MCCCSQRFWAYNVLYIMVSRAAPPLGEGVSTLQDFTPPLYVLLQNRYACHRLPVSYLHLVAGGLQRSRIPSRRRNAPRGTHLGSPRPTYSPSHNSRTAARPRVAPARPSKGRPTRSAHHEGLRSHPILRCQPDQHSPGTLSSSLTCATTSL